MLQPMGSQRVGHNLATEQQEKQRQELIFFQVERERLYTGVALQMFSISAETAFMY